MSFDMQVMAGRGGGEEADLKASAYLVNELEVAVVPWRAIVAFLLGLGREQRRYQHHQDAQSKLHDFLI